MQKRDTKMCMQRRIRQKYMRSVLSSRRRKLRWNTVCNKKFVSTIQFNICLEKKTKKKCYQFFPFYFQILFKLIHSIKNNLKKIQSDKNRNTFMPLHRLPYYFNLYVVYKLGMHISKLFILLNLYLTQFEVESWK